MMTTLKIDRNEMISKGNVSYVTPAPAPAPIAYKVGDLFTIEDCIRHNVPTAITRHVLKALYARGNMTAGELLRGANGVFDTADLEQEVITAMIECGDALFDGDGGLCFDDPAIVKAVFGAVSTFMYRHATRHYKRAYIEIDGDTVRIDNVAGLAGHADIDAIIEDAFIQEFTDTLTTAEKRFFELRLDGLTVKECALHMGLSLQNVRTIEKHLRTKWANFNK